MFTNIDRPSAVDVLRPFAVGDLFTADTTSTLAKLPIGLAGQVLHVNSAASAPAWTSTIAPPGLTASRIVTTNSVGAMVTPSAVITDQTLTLSTAAGTTLTVSSTDTTAAISSAGCIRGLSFRYSTGVLMASSSGDYHLLHTQSGGNGIFLGGAGDPSNYYNNTVHYFRTAASALILTVHAGGFAYTGAAGTDRAFVVQSASVNRWGFGVTATAESGGDAGSNYAVAAFTDAGVFIDYPIQCLRVAGGALTIARPFISSKSSGRGVTSTATAAGTTTLTVASTEIQTFTGVTTQTVQFPAANLFGAGIAVLFTINNQSSGIITPTRAGADTFQGGGTTDPVAAGASQDYASDGVSVWLKV